MHPAISCTLRSKSDSRSNWINTSIARVLASSVTSPPKTTNSLAEDAAYSRFTLFQNVSILPKYLTKYLSNSRQLFHSSSRSFHNFTICLVSRIWESKERSNSFSVPNVRLWMENTESLGGCSTITALWQPFNLSLECLLMLKCVHCTNERPNWSQRPCAQLEAESFGVESVSKKNKTPSARVVCSCHHSLSSVFVGLWEENNGSVWLSSRLASASPLFRRGTLQCAMAPATVCHRMVVYAECTLRTHTWNRAACEALYAEHESLAQCICWDPNTFQWKQLFGYQSSAVQRSEAPIFLRQLLRPILKFYKSIFQIEWISSIARYHSNEHANFKNRQKKKFVLLKYSNFRDYCKSLGLSFAASKWREATLQWIADLSCGGARSALRNQPGYLQSNGCNSQKNLLEPPTWGALQIGSILANC